MIRKVVSCSIALTLVILAYGEKHEELLEDKFEYYPGVGYYYFGTSRNWTSAQKDCMSSKGRLAVINSEEERQTVVSFLLNRTQENYVYGGFTNRLDTQYVTTEGIAIKRTGYTNWEAGKPSTLDRRCGGINTKTGELTDLPCTDEMPYICERQLWTDITYTYFEGIGKYKLHAEGKSWMDAYDVCESEGAHLLVIDSQEEADAVAQIFNDHPSLPNTDGNNFVFIGFRAVMDDLAANSYTGTYLTIYGTSVSDLGYVKWYAGEPVVQNSFFCGTLVRGKTSYRMNSCNFKFAFFCEKELQEFKRT